MNNIIFGEPLLGLSNEDYHKSEGISSTAFRYFDYSCAVFENRHLFRQHSPHFDYGSLIHCSILEPHLLDEDFLECHTLESDTVAASKLRELNPTKTIVGKGLKEEAKKIAELFKLIFGHLEKDCLNEVSFIYPNKETGLVHKCRPDMWNKDVGIVYDVKTTSAKSPREFMLTIEKYNYDLSAAWYMDTINEIIRIYKLPYPKIEKFIWLVIEKGSNIPYCFFATPQMIEKGRSKYQEKLDVYADYKKTGIDPTIFKPAFTMEDLKNNGFKTY